MTTDSHQNAERGVFDKEVRTAVAHERKRRAGNRHKSDIHPHVNDKLREEINGNSRSKERLKILSRMSGNSKDPKNNDAKKRKQYEDAQKPPFFGEGCKDKIGLKFRMKLQLALRAVSDPFPE